MGPLINVRLFVYLLRNANSDRNRQIQKRFSFPFTTLLTWPEQRWSTQLRTIDKLVKEEISRQRVRSSVGPQWNRLSIMINDDRSAGRFSVGQNMARAWTTRPPGPYDDQPNWRQMINGWFDEVHHYQTGYSDATGHYTQVSCPCRS